MEALLISGLTSVGKEILYKLIMETCTLINKKEQHVQIRNKLAELDLEADLQVIMALINETELSEKEENVADVVDIALFNVKQKIEIIKKELETIQKIEDSHKNSYFAYYRTPPFYQNLDNLTRHKKILDRRVDFLIKVLTLKNGTQKPFNSAHSFSPNTIGLISDLSDLIKNYENVEVPLSFYDEDNN